MASPTRFLREWKLWKSDLTKIPRADIISGLPIFYPRYTSPPKQLFYATWGFFAYPFTKPLIKDLHTTRSFELIHAHYATPAGAVALLAKRWMKVPVILSVHGTDVTYTAQQNPISARIIRWVFQNVDLIIANSSWTLNRIVKYGGNPKIIQIVRLGGDGPESLLNQNPPNPNGTIRLLTVGYLEERKGHAYVLYSVAELKKMGYKIHYVLVGDGPQRGRLEKLTDELGISDSVTFEGNKTHPEVWVYYQNCDICVLPSWNEAFGIAYIEALSLGIPVIGCKGEGGPEDLIALGDCIELVTPRDISSLSMALIRLIENPERRVRMGEIGRNIVRSHFTWANNASDTLSIYKLFSHTN
jgi:glycosyltransferase involved in cell wall biosynthesis